LVPLPDTATAYIEPGSPWQNPNVVSFNARLRDGVLDVELFASLAEARLILAEWRSAYNAEHPHSALGMLSPARFAPAWPQRRAATQAARAASLRSSTGLARKASETDAPVRPETDQRLSSRVGHERTPGRLPG
jgi:hypothetical protein